ncbi:hypothetical protein JKP88DRAFT_334726 [Tribonema minus]|uniref:Calmodulin n=1 Tax=Tribonema minus TaxID=303371 RepID=A0A835YKB5_9STRA|nr:hypothetical protein JKP88DRAFT_334726 [Tribonema minus]
MAELQARIAVDLADKARRAERPPLEVARRAFRKFNAAGSGVVGSADFRRGAERLRCGALTPGDIAALLSRFDPAEEGKVSYDAFAVWAAGGCDAARALEKLGRCLALLRARAGTGCGRCLRQRRRRAEAAAAAAAAMGRRG